MRLLLSLGLLAACLTGCTRPTAQPAAPAQAEAPVEASVALPPAAATTGQRGNGLPYEVVGSEVWNVPDPVSGRDYQVFVALPPSYAEDPARRYPVLYVTDADYAFPVIRQIARRLNIEGPAMEEFILVGLSYAAGEHGMVSRRRDYTPTPRGPRSAPADAEHGKGEAYATYLREQVLPFIAGRWRTDESRRALLGHSYGGLLGAQILLTDPGMFSGYILGSPSFWYDRHVMDGYEQRYAQSHEDLQASVYIYVGQYEQRSFGKDADMVSDARRMARALRARQYPSLRLEMDVLDDEDHLSVAPRGFTHGLKYLFGSNRG